MLEFQHGDFPWCISWLQFLFDGEKHCMRLVSISKRFYKRRFVNCILIKICGWTKKCSRILLKGSLGNQMSKGIILRGSLSLEITNVYVWSANMSLGNLIFFLFSSGCFMNYIIFIVFCTNFYDNFKKKF